MKDTLSCDPAALPSPCYVCDLKKLRSNVETIAGIRSRTGCRILLALKGFAMFSTFPLISKYLQGIRASSPHEARLGAEEFGGEVHVHAPAYSQKDMEELLPLIDHISFNSFAQWNCHKETIAAAGRAVLCGLRVNPAYSEVEVALYNPCGPDSRLGILVEEFAGQNLTGISGLHFHALCEQNSDTLERTLKEFERQFGSYLHDMEWVNFGGGHHITREDYDIDRLCQLIDRFQERYKLQVYLEPGEAIALNAGYLVATVLDIIEREKSIAILDTSATAHMPDVLEMPYRPVISDGAEPGVLPHTYQLGGLSCLAGDVIGDYSFAKPLQVGQKLIFHDMLHYTMVKNTTFNGLQLPAIVTYGADDGAIHVIREFGYQDYRSRLS